MSTIDGKQVSVSSAGPTAPGWEERFPSLGMPKSKTPAVRGDFVVAVNVRFPASLRPAQKDKLREIL